MYDKKVKIIKFITTSTVAIRTDTEIHFHENNFSTEWNFQFNMRAYALKVNEKTAYYVYSTPHTVASVLCAVHDLYH